MASPYTPVLIWASTAGQTGYIREKNFVKEGPIVGVMSLWAQDVEYYDGENYRDLPFPDASIAVSPEEVFIGGDYVVAGTPDATPPVTTAVTANDGTTNDDILHIPPRPEKHIKTLFTLWDNAAGTGNVLYSTCTDITEWSFIVSENPPKMIR